MSLRVGYIPYLNMAPFHQGFGPTPVIRNEIHYEFPICTPRTLGIEAEQGHVDAGALSLIDTFRLADRFEPLGQLGIGVKGPAQSVLVFSRVPLSELSGLCAVTDETATSVRLLEMLLVERYQRPAVQFGRIASGLLFDGDADAVLLIGDEALRAKRTGIPGFPLVTDLGSEWLAWQQTPFVFARWMARKTLDINVKHELLESIENALNSALSETLDSPSLRAKRSNLTSSWTDSIGSTERLAMTAAYWSGFNYRLTPAHDESMRSFEKWVMAHA